MPFTHHHHPQIEQMLTDSFGSTPVAWAFNFQPVHIIYLLPGREPFRFNLNLNLVNTNCYRFVLDPCLLKFFERLKKTLLKNATLHNHPVGCLVMSRDLFFTNFHRTTFFLFFIKNTVFHSDRVIIHATDAAIDTVMANRWNGVHDLW